jgi:hypothetical protein
MEFESVIRVTSALSAADNGLGTVFRVMPDRKNGHAPGVPFCVCS